MSRRYVWVGIIVLAVALIAIVSAYNSSRSDAPGQEPPHAIDQSQ